MSPRPTKSSGKRQRLAEHREQRLDVLAGGDASEQHHLGARRPLGEGARVPVEGPAVARVAGGDVDLGELVQRLEGAERIGRLEARARRDHQRSRRAGRRRGERPRVGELAAEVEAAREAHHLAQRGALRGAEGAGERELGARVPEQLRADAAEVRRREEEDPRHGRHLGLRRPVGATAVGRRRGASGPPSGPAFSRALAGPRPTPACGRRSPAAAPSSAAARGAGAPPDRAGVRR